MKQSGMTTRRKLRLKRETIRDLTKRRPVPKETTTARCTGTTDRCSWIGPCTRLAG